MLSSNKRFIFSLVATAVALAGNISLSYGQGSPTKQLETITVTAQKRTQNLQQVPVAVTVINGQQLIESASVDLFDIEKQVPTFSAFQSQSATNSAFAIRGIGTSSQNFGFESSVGLYVDGVFRPRQNSVINDLIDVESVEILRGPQGTLFGKNTPSGAVSIQTAPPQINESDGFVSYTAGNFSLHRLSAAKTVSAIDDELAFRVTAFDSNRDGFVEDIAHPTAALNDRNRSGMRIQSLYQPNNTMSLRVIADYAQLDEVCCAALTWQDNRVANEITNQYGTDSLLLMPPINATLFTRNDFFDFTTALSQSPRSKMEDKGISAEFDWQIDYFHKLVSITALRQFDSYDSTDTDFSDAQVLSTVNDAKQQGFSQEFQLHADMGFLSAIVGAYYFTQSLDLDFVNQTGSDFPTFFAASSGALTPLLAGLNQLSVATSGLIAPVAMATPAPTQFSHSADQNQDSYAIYGQATWKLTPQWTIDAGLRYTREEKHLTGTYTETGPQITGLSVDPATWPNPALAGAALVQISTDLQSGNMPSPSDLAALAPFQTPGWGYYFLGTASVMPRPDMNETIKDNQITGTAKLSFQQNKDTLWYLSWASGFKSGGINTDRISVYLNPKFDAETSSAWEAGLKTDFPQQNVRVNIAAHYTKIDDYQATTFTGTGFNLQNAGSITTKGLEVDATWYASANTEVSFHFARTLATFDEFSNGTCWVAYTWHTGIDDKGRANPSDPYCSRKGDRVGFEPETAWTLGITQIIEIGKLTTSLKAGYQYTGDYYLDDSNDPYKHIGSYELLNVSWLAEIPQWNADIVLWSRNLLDENYVARNGFDVPVQTGKLMAYPGMPRTFGVTFTKRFE